MSGSTDEEVAAGMREAARRNKEREEREKERERERES
jgi:hypothetical protein